MKNCPLILIVVLLSGACISVPSSQENQKSPITPTMLKHSEKMFEFLWALTSKDGQEALRAEEAIRSTKDAGVHLLVNAIRTVGDENALYYLALSLGCGKPKPKRRSTIPAKQAATVLGRWLSKEPDLALSLAQGGGLFERRVALMSQIGNAEQLLKLMALLGAKGDREDALSMTGVQALTCLNDTDPEGLGRLQDSLQKSMITLQGLLDKTGWPRSCAAPDHDLTGLGEAMASGKWFYAGSSVSNGELNLTIKQVDTKGLVFFSPECAWNLYEQEAKQGHHLPYLLEGLVRASLVPIGIRRKAAQRLADDIQTVEDRKQNDLLALAINAGAKSDRLVRVDPQHTYHREHLIEAAFRQGQKDIRVVLERHLRCPYQKRRCPECKLLGLLNTPAAIEDAWLRSRDCIGAQKNATIALILAEDPRAPQALERLVSSKLPMLDDLDVVLSEKDTPALRASLAKKAEEGNRHAIHLRTALGWEK